MTFLESTPNWLAVASFILGPTGIVIAIVTWIRFRKKDTADTYKTDAETEKLRADASLVKATADATSSDIALKLAQRLSDDNNLVKQDLKEKEVMLDKTQEDLNSVRMSLNSALHKIDELQVELNKERLKNLDMTEKNKAMELEIEKLKEHLKTGKS